MVACLVQRDSEKLCQYMKDTAVPVMCVCSSNAGLLFVSHAHFLPASLPPCLPASLPSSIYSSALILLHIPLPSFPFVSHKHMFMWFTRWCRICCGAH